MECSGPTWRLTDGRWFPGTATEAAFLLGGIGTGTVSLGSRGQLLDWEIFNRPGRGSLLPNAHAALWVRPEGQAPIARILESRLTPPLRATNGLQPYTAGGLPRLARSRLRGEYPFVRVEFEDDVLPVRVRLDAFTPFIPLNTEDSSIPGAVLEYTVENPSRRRVDVTIVASLMNPVGGIGFDEYHNLQCRTAGRNVNELRQRDGLVGILFRGEKYPPGSLEHGDMTLATTNPSVTWKRAWYRGEWWDYLQEFWDDLREDGRLTDLGYESPSADGSTDTGSLGAMESLVPGEARVIRFILSWCFPHRLNGWSESLAPSDPAKRVARNWYARLFPTSWHAAAHLARYLARLREGSRLFHDALYGSSLPRPVIDAAANNLAALRSTTCFRLDDGTFYGYEGCFDDAGCCPGTCTHVWNFAQSAAFLFPELERSMRRTEYLQELEPDGMMPFRAFKAFGATWLWKDRPGPPAADGQLGSLVRVFREWRLSGDAAFLRDLWPGMKRSLAFALARWDLDGDLVLEAEHHTSYDIELYGANSLSTGWLLAALSAMEEMAEFLGDAGYAETLRGGFERAARRVDELCWNGEYYEQRVSDVDEHKYQYGKGCLSDQLVGQVVARVAGLGRLLPAEHVRSALQSVYRYNFRASFADHHDCQRSYAINDDAGLLLCSWPRGGRPRFPFVYSDETWPGSEYAVAAGLVYEGLLDEAVIIVRAVQDRHDGVYRNPWNEIECGNHYARSMSSWALVIAWSGFTCDLSKNEMSFTPAVGPVPFTTFWSTGKAWGTYAQRRGPGGSMEPEVVVLEGEASGLRVRACGKDWLLP